MLIKSANVSKLASGALVINNLVICCDGVLTLAYVY